MPDLAADLPTAFMRHHQVKHDQVRRLAAPKLHGLHAVLGGDDQIPLPFQIPAAHIRNIRIVICNQHPFLQAEPPQIPEIQYDFIIS
ncbi:hypothetical protein D3C71_2023330 [compost metagenome]